RSAPIPPIFPYTPLFRSLSVSIMKERIDFDQLEGDRGDLDLVDLNQRPVFVDFDYGMTYRNNSFRVQLAVPNIRRVLIEKNMRRSEEHTSELQSRENLVC